MARIAISRSGNRVEEASTMAACTEIHDFKVMLVKRSKPGWEIVHSPFPIFMLARGLPLMVKITGKAANINGRTKAERFKMVTNPNLERMMIEKMIANRRI